MKKLILTAALSGLCAFAFAQNSAIYKAQSLQEKGEIKAAADLLDEALKNPKTTKFAQMYNMAAELQAQIFNPELMKAAQGVPFDTTLFVTTLDKMVDYYTKSHEADITPDKKGKVKSKYVQANHDRMMAILDYYNYAAVFMNQSGKADKSMEYFEKYLNLPKNPIFSEHETDSIYASKRSAYSQTAFNLALLNFNAKSWDKAIEYADVALEDTLGTRDLYIIKMQSYLAKNDSTTWLKTLTDAVKRTEDEGFMQNLLYYYVVHNDIQGATAMADELVAANPNNKGPWYMKGCVELNLLKDYAASRTSFEKALAIDPNYIDANVNMAYTYMNEVVSRRNKGEFKLDRTNVKQFNEEFEKIKVYYEKALPYFEKVRELAPDQPRLWASALQQIYTNLQQPDKAKEMDAYIESSNANAQQ